MIKAVIFDYGGVVTKSACGDESRSMVKMAKDWALAHNSTKVPGEEVFASIYDKYSEEFDRGYITGSQMYEMALRESGYEDMAKDEEFTQALALRDMQSWREMKSDVVDWALSLKARGFLLGVISNMPSEFLSYYGDENALFKAADHCSFSCECHYIKPEHAIYEDCVIRLDIKPWEAVFFDDSEENIKTARLLGFSAHLWKGLPDAQRYLASVLD